MLLFLMPFPWLCHDKWCPLIQQLCHFEDGSQAAIQNTLRDAAAALAGCTSHKSNQKVVLPSSRPEGNRLFKKGARTHKQGVDRNKNHVGKWQEGGKHLDSTELRASLFIQHHFAIKLTYQYTNTNTHTHASRVFKSIIRQQPNEDSCLPLQGDLALRWAKKSFLRENYKAEAEIQPILFKPTCSEEHSAMIKNMFLMFYQRKVPRSGLKPNQHAFKTKQ